MSPCPDRIWKLRKSLDVKFAYFCTGSRIILHRPRRLVADPSVWGLWLWLLARFKHELNRAHYHFQDSRKDRRDYMMRRADLRTHSTRGRFEITSDFGERSHCGDPVWKDLVNFTTWSAKAVEILPQNFIYSSRDTLTISTSRVPPVCFL